MNIYAIGDLHLSLKNKINPDNLKEVKQYKPMDCFGEKWFQHQSQIYNNWQNMVKENDIVLIPGDISWAMNLEETEYDFDFIDKLPGKKILLKGNHDYWWQSITRVREKLPENTQAIQNDSIIIENIAVAGTRGWICPNNEKFTTHDQKIYNREINRLKMSLDSLNKEYRYLIVMFHYMPVNENYKKNELIEILIEYGVDICIYGHLHGDEAHQKRLPQKKWGINFKLISSDYLDFKPELVITVKKKN